MRCAGVKRDVSGRPATEFAVELVVPEAKDLTLLVSYPKMLETVML